MRGFNVMVGNEYGDGALLRSGQNTARPVSNVAMALGNRHVYCRSGSSFGDVDSRS